MVELEMTWNSVSVVVWNGTLSWRACQREGSVVFGWCHPVWWWVFKILLTRVVGYCLQSDRKKRALQQSWPLANGMGNAECQLEIRQLCAAPGNAARNLSYAEHKWCKLVFLGTCIPLGCVLSLEQCRFFFPALYFGCSDSDWNKMHGEN